MDQLKSKLKKQEVEGKLRQYHLVLSFDAYDKLKRIDHD